MWLLITTIGDIKGTSKQCTIESHGLVGKFCSGLKREELRSEGKGEKERREHERKGVNMKGKA